MGMGRANENVSSINWKIVQEMDKRNQVNRCFDKPVRKDTVVIPYNGYVVLRFRANNPGESSKKKELLSIFNEEKFNKQRINKIT